MPISRRNSSRIAVRPCRRAPWPNRSPGRRRQGDRPHHGAQGRDRLPLAQTHRRTERTLRRQVRLHHQPPELRDPRRRSRTSCPSCRPRSTSCRSPAERSSGWTTSCPASARRTARWPSPKPAACTTCSQSVVKREKYDADSRQGHHQHHRLPQLLLALLHRRHRPARHAHPRRPGLGGRLRNPPGRHAGAVRPGARRVQDRGLPARGRGRARYFHGGPPGRRNAGRHGLAARRSRQP